MILLPSTAELNGKDSQVEISNKQTNGWGIWYDGANGYTPGFVQGAGGFATFGTEQAAQAECTSRELSAAYKPRQIRITEIVETLD